MSLAQDAYIALPPHTHAPAMDLNTIVTPGHQPYDNRMAASIEDPMNSQLQASAGSNYIPAATSLQDSGRIYSLEIRQQPVRARMCGFGDKDRRPITPPPCIRLVVRDANTMQEIDVSEIDTSYFVLSVDLWSGDGTKEVNLVRHSATSPSISAATSASYPPPSSQSVASGYPSVDPNYNASMNHQMAYQQPGYPQSYNPSQFPKQSELYHYQQLYKMEHQPSSHHHHHLPSSHPNHPSLAHGGPQSYHGSAPVTPSTPTGQPTYYMQGPLLSPDQMTPSTDPRSQQGGMFTRNLIGSLCVSAFKLTDDTNRMGVWFVLQDLSVRTEGTFRIKMNFVNVGQTASSIENSMMSAKTSSSQNVGKLNTGSAPVLASCFSEPFDVYSAKKFPGVIESTKLSKCFATQGIKIPIRKDGVRGNERGSRDEDDEVA